MRDADPMRWVKTYWHRRKNRRKSWRAEFTVAFDELVWPEHCPVLGLKLDYSNRDWECGFSLDRLNLTKGYVPDNVRVISQKANILKSDGTAEEHRRIAAWIRGQEIALHSAT